MELRIYQDTANAPIKWSWEGIASRSEIPEIIIESFGNRQIADLLLVIEGFGSQKCRREEEIRRFLRDHQVTKQSLVYKEIERKRFLAGVATTRRSLKIVDPTIVSEAYFGFDPLLADEVKRYYLGFLVDGCNDVWRRYNEPVFPYFDLSRVEFL